MGFVARVWKDPVWSKLIAGAIGVGFLWIVHLFFGTSFDEAYNNAFSVVRLPRWLVWSWGLLTLLLLAAGSLLLRRRVSSDKVSSAAGTITVSSSAALDPKIEIRTEDRPPYQITDVKSGHVESTVKVGITNAGGKTLSNCKVFIERIAPPPNLPGGDTQLLEGSGFHLRHDDPEKLIDIASHWDHIDKFKFSTPMPGGFFNNALYMEDGLKRTFAVRVVATECERSALFEIETDAAKRLHLKFLNYIN
ncbi:hypothetical protein OWS73_37005 [Burkholderia sp. 1B3(2022)]|uniref:hypothetical protein n=1 Tax=Burkholderia sp. 1B3(2022) TaxID=2997425 RepID=UPI002FC7B29C